MSKWFEFEGIYLTYDPIRGMLEKMCLCCHEGGEYVSHQ